MINPNCVNTSSEEFKKASRDLNISPVSLEPIVHKFQNTPGNESLFPTDDYIKNNLYGTSNIVSKEGYELYNKSYSSPQLFNSVEELRQAIDRAARFFNSDSITSYTTNDGKYVMLIAEPTLEGEFSTTNDDINLNIPSDILSVIQKFPWEEVSINRITTRHNTMYKRHGKLYITLGRTGKRDVRDNPRTGITTADEIERWVKLRLIRNGINPNAIKFIPKDERVLVESNDAIPKMDRKLISDRSIETTLTFLESKIPGLSHRVVRDRWTKLGEWGIPENANAFFRDGVVYLIMGRFNEDIAIEECLHPLVDAIKIENPELFNQLYTAAKELFPTLYEEINRAYDEKSRDYELVTQALSRNVREELKTEKDKSKWKKLVDKFYNYIKNLFGEINIGSIKPTTTFKELAQIITSEDGIFNIPLSGTKLHIEEDISNNEDQEISPTFYEGNIIPDKDTIFVFGSNPEGRHGAGAARIAAQQFGAQYGVGEGLTGNSYALPTKDLRVKENRGLRSIPKDTIVDSIKKLYDTARTMPNKQFKVAYRNTDTASLNGYTGLEMIDMFKEAGPIPSNVVFSKEWVDTGRLSKLDYEEITSKQTDTDQTDRIKTVKDKASNTLQSINSMLESINKADSNEHPFNNLKETADFLSSLSAYNNRYSAFSELLRKKQANNQSLTNVERFAIKSLLKDTAKQLSTLREATDEVLDRLPSSINIWHSTNENAHLSNRHAELSPADRAYIEQDNKLNSSINNLMTSEVLTASEVMDIAGQMVNWISDRITEIKNKDPELLKKYEQQLKDLDLDKADRIDIIRAIGPTEFIAECQKAFIQGQSKMTISKLNKLKVLKDNWNALIQLAESTFIENERFSMVISGEEISVKEATNEDDLNTPTDSQEIQESGRSTQENWQIEARTKEVMKNASALVRDAFRQCYVLDKNGNRVKTEWGIDKRVKVREAVASVLKWTQGMQDIDEMIDMLEQRAESNPWITQIIDRLKDTTGNEADFQSQFFSTMCLREQLYSAGVTEETSTGDIVYKSITVNKSPALREIVKSITTQYKIGKHPLFTLQGMVNETELNGILEVLEYLRGENIPNTNKEYALSTLYSVIGAPVEDSTITEIINNEDTYNKVIKAFEYISSKLKDNKDRVSYNPFNYDTEDNILGNMRAALKPLAEKITDTTLSSFYHEGKMYQTYTLPSYLSNLLSKFHKGDDAKFEEFISKQYASSEWFKRATGDLSTGWWNPWINRMMKDKNARKVFDHKVQLSFNEESYMTEMGDLSYALSMFTEYFSEKGNSGDSVVPAWFRVPMLSNKTSSEYIKFFKYVGDTYKDSIAMDLTDIMQQEINRIRTVRMRNLKRGDKGYIKNWDERGKTFCLVDFFNKYLEGGERANTSFANLLEKAINGKITKEENRRLILDAEEIIKRELSEKAAKTLAKWEEDGLIEAAKKVKGISTSEEGVRADLENFIWNDYLAAINILEITITDPAYYDGAVDLQKRFAQIHAPGRRPNVKATDYGDGTEGSAKRVADDYSRTIVINDWDKVKSNTIENLNAFYARKIEESTTDAEREFYSNMRDNIVSQFEDINVTDAQAYNSPRSFMKKMILFGKRNRQRKAAYDRIISGDYKYTDFEIAFGNFGEIVKDFVYTQTVENVGVTDSPIQNIPVPFQNKNSEYLLIMADAILRGEKNNGRPNLLRAIYDVMEETAKANPTKGIDTVQFTSAVKSGLHDAIDISQFIDNADGEKLAKEHILNSIYEQEEVEVLDQATGARYTETRRGTNYSSTVRLIDWMDYAIQQEVPAHFMDGHQAHGSQGRAITASDINPDATFMVDGKPVKGNEFTKEWEETISQNIEQGLRNLATEFRLSGSRKERNIALAKILKNELKSSSRYGIELKQACLLNEDGEFVMPVGDPTQSRRIEQLLNSIVKNRVNKQEIAGGPAVQVTNFGTSKKLNIKFKSRELDENGKSKLLMTRSEWESNKTEDSTYEDYIKKNQAGVAYLEVYAPIYSKELVYKFMDSNGVIDVEAMEALDPDLLKMVGYRIPTEDKYSMAPIKIVGFLPREAGDGIMLPDEITVLSGSDFDVDKIYLMRKEIPIKTRSKNAIISDLYNIALKRAEKQNSGKVSIVEKQAITDEIKRFVELVQDRTDNNFTTNYERFLWDNYRKIAYEVAPHKEGVIARNNKIVDMTYEVLTHEDSFDKIMNPGGFDPQKKMGYMIAAARLGYKWKDLQNMKIKDLQKLVATNQNLAYIDTHLQFYKQNSAAAALLGIFAVNKVAHAIAQRSFLHLDFSGSTGLDIVDFEPDNIMRIGNSAMTGVYTTKINSKGKAVLQDGIPVEACYIRISPTKDSSGNFINKVLGSLVASAADAAKDPVLNLMNINKDTANILTTAIKMGYNFEDIALLLSQQCVSDVLNTLSKKRLKGEPASLQSIISERIATLEEETGLASTGSTGLLKEGLSTEELINGINNTTTEAEIKTLTYIQALLNMNNDLSGVTLATRLNSISSAAGPTIVDNIIMENKMSRFSNNIATFNNDNYLGVGSFQQLLDMHPMLNSFSKAFDMARQIMSDMPLYSEDFTNILESLDTLGVEGILDDRETLSKFGDFYKSYILITSGVVDPLRCSYYINDFPMEFMSEYRNEFQDNPLVNAIKLQVDSNNFTSLRVDITGLEQEYQDVLIAGFIDIWKKNKELAIDLFNYNFFRGGLGFTPKTFMSLVPIVVKQDLEGYRESFINIQDHSARDVVDKFVRNNWRNYKLVKFLPATADTAIEVEGELQELPNFRINEKTGIYELRQDPALFFRYLNQGYVRTKVKRKDKLLRRKFVDKQRFILTYEEVAPLGNNNSYLEFTNNPIEVKTVTSERGMETGIARNPNDVQTEPPIKPGDMNRTSIIETAFIAAGLSQAQTSERVVKFKSRTAEEKQAKREAIKEFMVKQFEKLNLPLSEEELNAELNKLCD